MKRLALLVVLLALTAACGNKASQSSLVSGPTPVDASVTVPDLFQFDATQLGRMTLTNTHTTSMDYTFIVWRHSADDNPVNKAQASYRLAPGETRVLTVGLQEECGAKYDRNVFVGLASIPNANPFTMSDLGNYPRYAAGALWVELACDAPAPPPPPPTVFCASLVAVLPVPPPPSVPAPPAPPCGQR